MKTPQNKKRRGGRGRGGREGGGRGRGARGRRGGWRGKRYHPYYNEHVSLHHCIYHKITVLCEPNLKWLIFSFMQITKSTVNIYNYY